MNLCFIHIPPDTCGQKWSMPVTNTRGFLCVQHESSVARLLQSNAYRLVVLPWRPALGTPKATPAGAEAVTGADDGDGPTRCVVDAGLFASSLS